MAGRSGRARIPVGRDGFVPLRDIVKRFHEVGDISRDSGRTASRVLPSRLTPEEIRVWWDDPSSCDIEGVDTDGSPVYSVPLTIVGRKRAALRRVAVLSSKDESDRIKRVLAESFTADELERMAGGRSFIIATEPHLRDCTGYYLRRQEGVPVPTIVLEEGTTPDGIVHEAVHHLRVVDGRTSFPTTEGKVLDKGYKAMSRPQKDEVFRKEETETVAETVARTKVDPVESGYYSGIPGMDARTAYLRDQRIVSGSRALKGKAAVKAAEMNYDKTSISRAIVTSNKKRRKSR